MIPPMSRMGTKTAMSEMLIETTVKPTSRAPSSAASNGEMPCSMCRDTFSRTTTASSTTKPVAMVRAMSERLSRLYPARYMMPKVPMSETGTATAGIVAARHRRRNRKTTRITREMEMRSVLLHLAQGGADGGRAVGGDLQVDRLRDRGLQHGQDRLHAIDGLDHVGARLAPHQEQHRGPVRPPAPRCADPARNRSRWRYRSDAPPRRCGRRRRSAGSPPPFSPGRWRRSASGGCHHRAMPFGRLALVVAMAARTADEAMP